VSIHTLGRVALAAAAAQLVQLAFFTLVPFIKAVSSLPSRQSVTMTQAPQIALLVIVIAAPLANSGFFFLLYRETRGAVSPDMRRACAFAAMVLTALTYGTAILMQSANTMWSKVPVGSYRQPVFTTVRTALWPICWVAMMAIFAGHRPFTSKTLRALAGVLGALTVIGAGLRIVETLRSGKLTPYLLLQVAIAAAMMSFFVVLLLMQRRSEHTLPSTAESS
jgi:hypothetical protein